LLALDGPQTFQHREVDRRDLNGTFAHFDQISMQARKALPGAVP
jgi:hypothetical protein